MKGGKGDLFFVYWTVRQRFVHELTDKWIYWTV